MCNDDSALRELLSIPDGSENENYGRLGAGKRRRRSQTARSLEDSPNSIFT